MTTDLVSAKQTLRAASIARRAGHDPAACGARLAAHVLHDCPPPPNAVVSAFWPLGDEIDLRPLMTLLHARGNPVALPVTPKRGLPLTFRRWHPDDPMERERFGTMRPTGAEVVPDFLLIPLLAFDAAGRRLGYGGGFYDRTLATLPGRFRLGCAYAAQLVDEVPAGPYDMPLDAVATECGVLRCGGG
jgi:5-formyltetrahydrofolate cyclo-ligase